MRKGLITLCWHRQMPLYIFSLRSRRLSHEIENDPSEEIYSKHELLSHSGEEICSFIFMKLLKIHFIFLCNDRFGIVYRRVELNCLSTFCWKQTVPTIGTIYLKGSCLKKYAVLNLSYLLVQYGSEHSFLTRIFNFILQNLNS